MIDELKELVALVNSLPQLALWVAIGFWAYKVIIVGSIYGVIRYVAGHLFDWLKLRHDAVVKVDVERFTIGSAAGPLVQQLYRIRGVDSGSESYIHSVDVEWLKEAIDAKIQAERETKERKVA